jgi:hypothetical protein
MGSTPRGECCEARRVAARPDPPIEFVLVLVTEKSEGEDEQEHEEDFNCGNTKQPERVVSLRLRLSDSVIRSLTFRTPHHVAMMLIGLLQAL